MEDKHFELSKIIEAERENIIARFELHSVADEDMKSIKYNIIDLSDLPHISFKILFEDFDMGEKEFCWRYILKDKEDCNRLVIYNFDKNKRQSVINAVNGMINWLISKKIIMKSNTIKMSFTNLLQKTKKQLEDL